MGIVEAAALEPQIAKHIDKVIIVVVFVSILPIVFKTAKGYLAKRKAAKFAVAGAPGA